MKYPMDVDVRQIIWNLDASGLRHLCFELLSVADRHPKECDCITVSEPMVGDEGEEYVLSTSSGKPCSCGVARRIGGAFSRALELSHKTLCVGGD